MSKNRINRMFNNIRTRSKSPSVVRTNVKVVENEFYFKNFHRSNDQIREKMQMNPLLSSVTNYELKQVSVTANSTYRSIDLLKEYDNTSYMGKRQFFWPESNGFPGEFPIHFRGLVGIALPYKNDPFLVHFTKGIYLMRTNLHFRDVREYFDGKLPENYDLRFTFVPDGKFSFSLLHMIEYEIPYNYTENVFVELFVYGPITLRFNDLMGVVRCSIIKKYSMQNLSKKKHEQQQLKTIRNTSKRTFPKTTVNVQQQQQQLKNSCMFSPSEQIPFDDQCQIKDECSVVESILGFPTPRYQTECTLDRDCQCASKTGNSLRCFVKKYYLRNRIRAFGDEFFFIDEKVLISKIYDSHKFRLLFGECLREYPHLNEYSVSEYAMLIREGLYTRETILNHILFCLIMATYPLHL